MRGVVVVCGLIVMSTAACHGGHSAQTSGRVRFPGAQPTQLPTTPGARVRRVAVGYGPYDVAAGDGELWVAVATGVVRVDPLRERVSGRFRAPNTMEWTNIAADHGAVWYLSGSGRQAVVRELDPDTLRAERVLPVAKLTGRNAYEGVAGTTDAACVGVLTGAVRCVGPAAHGGSFNVPGGSGGESLASAAHGVIVAGGDSIRRIITPTGQVTRLALPAGAFASAVAADGPRVWAVVVPSRGNDQLWSVAGVNVIHRRALPFRSVYAMAARDGRVWLIARGKIYAVPSDRPPVPIAAFPAGSRGLAATATALWTAQYQQGTVTSFSTN